MAKSHSYSQQSSLGTWLVMVFTMMVASVLNVYPLGDALANARPLFMFLVMLFWVVHSPQHFGVWFAFFTGLICDLLLDTGLGQQAFAAVLATFMLQYATKNSHNLNDVQVWLLASAAIIVFSLSLLFLQYFSGQVVLWHNGLPMLTSILAWPLVTIALHRF